MGSVGPLNQWNTHARKIKQKDTDTDTQRETQTYTHRYIQSRIDIYVLSRKFVCLYAWICVFESIDGRMLSTHYWPFLYFVYWLDERSTLLSQQQPKQTNK